MDTFAQKFLSFFSRLNPAFIKWIVFITVLVFPIIMDPGNPGDIGLHSVIPGI